MGTQTTTQHAPSLPAPPGGHRERDLLRLATAGSVDDGKSTLIGRLLYDTKSVLADQLAAVERASHARGGEAVDLALLTDGLRAEREQGITIDVAYRYFSTATRAFVLADTPGHVQYTRNMVTGASTAELAVVLVDARRGVLEQTRRHAAIAALLRVPHLVLAVNKMDLVDYAEDAFTAIADEFAAYAARLGVTGVRAIPVSALAGDNVVERSARMPWHTGPTLLEHLEQVPVLRDAAAEPLRFPVQYVIRPRTPEHPDYRGYAGRISAGAVAVGDEVVTAPGGGRSRVAGIDTFDGPLDVAHAPQSVTLLLEDDLDVARGDVLVAADAPTTVGTDLRGTVCWLAQQPGVAGTRVLVRTGTRTVRGVLQEVGARFDVDTLELEPSSGSLTLNAIGTVRVLLAEPVLLDDFAEHRRTGTFLLVDPLDGATLAAGMVGRSPLADAVELSGRCREQ
ncbi:GTP-binding protein [Cellulomonas cellasea]|uniref:sulfate adenylyltransferase subunit 1 n=1 Tax=Cellulomonas cellasea TaxID=43670 RepID=UPI0025A3F7FB|nr:GTP-binding protein [Cellulomonas cellasea]MDM8085391.1 GTP-binding protein [Cellulomonas cellasea]